MSDGDTDFQRLKRASARVDKMLGRNVKLGRAIQLITKESRPHRARPWFNAFMRQRVNSERELQQFLESATRDGLRPHQVVTLRDDFAAWKAKEKSRLAKLSRAARCKSKRKCRENC